MIAYHVQYVLNQRLHERVTMLHIGIQGGG